MLSTPFVISMDGDVVSDPSGEATDIELAGGASEVLAAGRWALLEGRLLTISNESPAYCPTLKQMHAALVHLAQAGLDLSGDGNGVVLIVYDSFDSAGHGANGTTYRVNHSDSAVELIPTQASEPLDWNAKSPEDFLTTPGLLVNEPMTQAAANARRFARAGLSSSYDEIGFRSRAATPTVGAVPLQTMAGMRFQRGTAQRKQLPAEVEKLLEQQRLLRHRPLDLPDNARLRYETTTDYIDFFVKFDGDDKESPGAWTFPLSSPPTALLKQMAEDSDLPMLFSQYGQINVPSFWLPLGTLIATAQFRRMQEWREDLSQGTQPGCFYAFVSHRWLTTSHPDPDGVQARFLSWQMIGHLCEAVRVASTRGLATPRKFSRLLGFPMGIHGSDIAESLIVNVLRYRLDDQSLQTAREEVAAIEHRLDDYGVAEAAHEDAMLELQRALVVCPTLVGLLNHIFIWYDYSCMPQRPHTESEEQEFRQALESLAAFQALSRTLVLLDSVEDYLSRAWCTLEAIVADTQLMAVDLLVGSARETARDGRVEYFFDSLLQDRPHLVWRALLDTEIFGVQSWSDCMRRLSLATTEAEDLPFTYESLLKLRAPTKVHVDSSELVTGIVPLPTSDGGNSVLWVRSLERSVALESVEREPLSLDWTGCLRIEASWGRNGGHSADDYPPLKRFDNDGKDASLPRCHVAVIASCEGEAVMTSRWVEQHSTELEEKLNVSIRSLSWVAVDIAPVGHFACGDLAANAVEADLWVVVSLSIRFSNCTLASGITELITEAVGSVTTVAIDLKEKNVTTISRDDKDTREASRDRYFALSVPEEGFPVTRGGLFRSAVARHLVQHD